MAKKVNASLKAWVAFVKKVQKQYKLSYKDAIHKAKELKDKGADWTNKSAKLKGGSPMDSEPMEDEVDMEGGEDMPEDDEAEMMGGRRRRRTRKRRGSRRSRMGRSMRRRAARRSRSASRSRGMVLGVA